MAVGGSPQCLVQELVSAYAATLFSNHMLVQKDDKSIALNLIVKKQANEPARKSGYKKPHNKDYFSGPENVQRVQQWRANNPGYSKKVSHSPPLQDVLISQVIDKQEQNPLPEVKALQEIITSQPVVLIGLIAHLTGSTLQDDIVRTGRKLRELGEDLLH